MTSECVKVIVRCRPMNGREKDLSCKNVVTMTQKTGQCVIASPHDPKAPPKSFTFDGAYGVDSTTECIYNDIAYPLVEGVTEGYNGTIFAYGQTGCGKSFSMQGIVDPPTQRGVIPRAFDHLFETVSVAEQTKFLIHGSYCEIYNEEIRDLLGKDPKAKMELKEHPERGVYVNGLTMHPVHNVVECEKIMDKGWKNRATGATLMNADSSRSHSIFTINLEMMTPDEEGEEHIRAGKLNLVDLAGSERQAKTGSTGDRLKEATKINLSLSALGNVISSLVDGKSKHIPYRDSKLTRLLQDSLGGNTKTLMIACLSPADNNFDETLSTLRYANRAKNIQNKPKINEDPKDALLRQYQEEIEKLKAMLMGQLPLPEGGFSDVAMKTAATSERSSSPAREELEQEKERIREEYDAKIEKMQEEFEEEKISKAKLQQDMTKLRAFYDEKITKVDGEIEKLPSTAEAKAAAQSQDMRMMVFRNLMANFVSKVDIKLGTKVLAEMDDDTTSQKKQGDGTEVSSKTSDKKKKGRESKVIKSSKNKVAKTVLKKKVVNGKEVVVKTTMYVDVDESGQERPMSVAGEELPVGPATVTGEIIQSETSSVLSTEEMAMDGTMTIQSVSEMGEEEGPVQIIDDEDEVDPDAVPGDGDEEDDGSIVQKSKRPDGSIVVRTIYVTGEVIERVTAPDGYITERAVQKDGVIAQKNIAPDGVVIASGEVNSEGVLVGADGNPLQVPSAEEEAVRMASVSKERKVAGDEGSMAPRSSPTQAEMESPALFQQEEALKRLHELEQQMVGGEAANNEDIKERRKKRKTFADERKRKLAEAVAKMDDDGIMLDIYDNIQDELKAKNKILLKEKEKVEMLEHDIVDIKSEFEFDRIDYLDTIRKQERQLMLMQEIIDRIQPCIRKDCNYSNLDRIKMECKWDDDEQKWILPKLTIERTALPVSGTILPGGIGTNGRASRSVNGDFEYEDDRFREKLMRKQDNSQQYFQTKRPSQLVQSSEPLTKINMTEVKHSYGITNKVPAPATNGHRGSMSENPMSKDLKAAKVHGQLMNDEGITRKPTRLEALPSVGKKSKRKKNNYDGM